MPKLRVFELPQNEYALVQKVKERLGLIAASNLQCLFSGSIQEWLVSRDEKEIIQQMARAHGVKLPLS
jgi:hypothetical protein